VEAVDVPLLGIRLVLRDFLDKGLVQQPEHLFKFGGVLGDPELHR